jgi:hypothetical protein
MLQVLRAFEQQSCADTHVVSQKQLPPLPPHSVSSHELQPLPHAAHALPVPLPGQQSPIATHIASQ